MAAALPTSTLPASELERGDSKSYATIGASTAQLGNRRSGTLKQAETVNVHWPGVWSASHAASLSRHTAVGKGNAVAIPGGAIAHSTRQSLCRCPPPPMGCMAFTTAFIAARALRRGKVKPVTASKIGTPVDLRTPVSASAGRVGSSANSNAAVPVACGAAIDVPLLNAMGGLGAVNWLGAADRMAWPGANSASPAFRLVNEDTASCLVTDPTATA